jgi:endonuclease/exonuclease/phosphatase family metal-dependent hydrolase
MKYNLVWDKVLDLGLFPQSVFDAETCAYQRLALPYGLPLDNRKRYTKTDWQLWCASFADRRECFDAIVDRVYRFADETPSRVAFSDWYWADSSKYVHFIGRSVIGGVFMPMLRDGAMWRKYASRDKMKTGVYAPLMEPARFRIVAPEGRASEDVKWKYTFSRPPEGWERPEFDDSGWQTGAGGFGVDDTPGASVRTKWSTKNIWLRRHVTLDAVPREPLLSLHHDDDTEVWFNGVSAGRFGGYSCGYETQGVFEDAAKALRKGDNVIASATRQDFGGQYIDYGLGESCDEEDAFNLATFNVRCTSPSDRGTRFWTNRFPRVVKVIDRRRFDIVGMQELTPKQRQYLDAALGDDWGRVGLGRMPDDTGESQTIYYRRSRFECLATDTFWLSETPRVPGSKSWNSACSRNCTWGLFRDRKTGRRFRYYNTHLDHVSNEARVMGMRVLLAEMRRLSQGETVFLTGDMNAHYKNVPVADRARLEAGGGPVIDDPLTIGDPISAALHALYDSRIVSETPHEGPLFTYSGYRPRNVCLIDYVFATGNVRVLRHATCNDRPDGVHPSDHDAVVARVVVK